MDFVSFLGIIYFFSFGLGWVDAVVDYMGYRVVRVVPKTNEAVDMLRRFEARGLMDLWTDPVRFHPVDVFLAPGNFSWFNEWIADRSIRHETLFDDFGQKLLRLRAQRRWRYGKCSGANMDWSQYNDYNCINSWMEHLSTTYPDKVTLKSIGTSYEGKPMKILWLHTGDNVQQKSVWIDAGIHAREWIGPAAVTWVASEMLDNYELNKRFVDQVDWFILPVANPDGYVHSWIQPEGEDTFADVPCSQRYAGPSMFSEPETRAIQQFLADANENETVRAFVSVHSYSQKVIYPWGYTKMPPADNSDMHYIAGLMASAMQGVDDRKFEVFPLEGRAAGISIDWAKGAMQIPYAFIIELRDKGRHGFLLPDDQIDSASEELWAAIGALLPHVVSEA